MGLFRRRPKPQGVPTYTNAAVIERIARENGVDHETARLWFGEMLVFLDLCATSGEMLSPPKPVDAAWHAFILHTRDYEAYCKERFGRVIHHQPTGEPDPSAYARAFEARSGSGAMDTTIWAIPAAATVAGGAAPSEPAEDRRDGGQDVGGTIEDHGSDWGESGSDSGSSDSGSSDSGGGSSCGGGGSSCGGGGA
jgi:uncharacterized membrane protein YgcG